MKFTILLVLILELTLLCTAANQYKSFSDDELSKTEIRELYRLFLAEHPHKKYTPSSPQGIARFEAFKINVERIVAKRKELLAGKKHWTAGLNSMSDVSDAEFQSMHGHKEADVQVAGAPPAGQSPQKSFLQRTEKKVKQQTPFPNQYNLSNLFLPARNQQTCGDCWAFTTATVMEGFYNQKNPNNQLYLSAQHVTACSNAGNNGGCNGGLAYVALSTFTPNGVLTETQQPFTLGAYGENPGVTCNNPTVPATAFRNVDMTGCRPVVTTYTYTRTSNGVSTVSTQVVTTLSNRANGATTATTVPAGSTCPDSGLNALLANGPVAVTIDGTAIQHYTGGIYDSACATRNHAVTAVGYGIDQATGLEYWLIRNSWAPTWGENGYIRIQRDFSNLNSCFVGSNYWQPTF